MNKKKLLLILLPLLAVVLVSGALVTYLSNTATAEVNVESPMEIKTINLNTANDLSGGEYGASGTYPYTLDGYGTWTTDKLVIPATTSLGTILVGLQVNNKGNVAIEGKILEVVVTNNNSDVSCGDIAVLDFLDTGTQYQIDKGFQNLASSPPCVDKGSYVVYNIPIESLAANTIYEYPVIITFSAEPAIYTFTAQMMME